MSLAMQLVKARKAGHFLGPNIGPGISRFQGPMMYSRGRAGQQGGIFGDIGKFIAGAAGSLVKGIPVIGGVLSSPLEAIAGGALDKKKKGIAASGGQPSVSVASFAPTGPGMGGAPGLIPSLPFIGGGSGGSTPTTSTGGTAVVPYKGCAPAGYHPNKSGYWKNQSGLLPGASWVEPGSILVKNRKRNPYNPRAASRAMSRLASLSQGMKTLERQLTKLAPRRPRASCKGACSKRK